MTGGMYWDAGVKWYTVQSGKGSGFHVRGSKFYKELYL